MKLSLISLSVLFLLLQIPAFSFAQEEAPGNSAEPAQSKEIVYYLYDLSTADQESQLISVLDDISSVDSYQIDLATHSVRFETETVLKQGTPEWSAFTHPIRNAMKSSGFVRVKQEDLHLFYPN